MVTAIHTPILKEKFPTRSSMSQDQLVNFPTSNQDTGYTFKDADASSRVTIELTLTQEDFDTATSVGPDVVEKTDANLDPMLAEGGEQPGQEQVRRTNKRKLIPFYFPQDIKLIILGSEPF